MNGKACRCCGTCCTAPDISALGKPLGVRCTFLDSDLRCSVYQERPEVCRRYEPDEICDLVMGATLEDRVGNFLRLFGLTPPGIP